MDLEELVKIYRNWFAAKGWKPFPFQEDLLQAYLSGFNGILNAPTGSGKTAAMWLPILMEWLRSGKKSTRRNGLQVLWITPVRALANDIRIAMQEACNELNIPWEVATRTGDTSAKERQKQKKQLPQCLITTPESLHVLFAQKGYSDTFSDLKAVVVDEWHELLGTKRGVQVELALSRLKALNKELKIWGISATIGNLDQALYVLLGEDIHTLEHTIIKGDIGKKIVAESLLPDEIEKYPWGGHLGIKLLPKIIPLITSGKSTLIFTNTRSQAEIWYQRLLEAVPQLAGTIALHHGSLSNDIRTWVEEAINNATIKVVVCTSTLDLGVDFRPVETVIQIGGPKGVARFMQRAGRSGHQPDSISHIYFVPTHSLELIEGAAIRTAIKENNMESRIPITRAFDVLIQYLITLAVSDGFKSEEIFNEVITTHAYNSISAEEWNKVMQFITMGGPSLKYYNEFSKVIFEDGKYFVRDRKIALRHRLSIGTIVSDASMVIKYLKGGYVGTIEEFFIARLKPGDVFSFAGKNLELVKVKDMQALVRRSGQKSTIVPQWMGGRMALSSQVSEMIRRKLTEAIENRAEDVEVKLLGPLFEMQKKRSIIPTDKQLLIEHLKSREGYHLFFFTFEGRYVNEGMASLLAYRISMLKPYTFSIAMTDYGFELLSEQEVDIAYILKKNIFSTDHLLQDIQAGMNATEMARRKFRDIAHIAGLVFQGFPGRQIKNKHLHASSRLFFEVFRDHEPGNLLLKQAYEEVLFHQLDEARLRKALQRINGQEIIIKYLEKPSPFCFPIMIERFREKLSSEKLQERVMRMIKQLEK